MLSDLPDVWKVAAERDRIDFLRTDLAICFTYVDLVETELFVGDPNGARLAFAKAENGYRTMCQFIKDVKNAEAHDEIERKLNDLGVRLDQVRPHLPTE